MDLSIVIVNWNTCDDLRRCLASVRDGLTGLLAEVLVVDNGSTDGSPRMVAEEFPDVGLLALDHNLGFAAGNNLALARCSGRYRLLLNPDCVVHDDALARLVAYADGEPLVGLLGPRLLNGDGSRQTSCRTFPTLGALVFRNTPLGRLWPNNPWARAYLMERCPPDSVADVDWLSGACLMARAETIDEIGLLDERYFMYCEDMDWCYQAHRHGWRVVYLPTARVTHLIGRASDRRPRAMVREHHRSMLRFVAKHYGPVAAALAAPLIGLRYLAIAGRARDGS